MSTLLLFICGAIAPLGFNTAPASWLSSATLGVAMLCLFAHRVRPAGVFLLAVSMTLGSIQASLKGRGDTSLEGQEARITGVVDSVPVLRGDSLEFIFKTQDSPGFRSPERIRVRWFQPDQEVSAGESWSMQLRLRPPRARVNFAGPDTERWYFAERIGGLASVVMNPQPRRLSEAILSWSRVRQSLRERIMMHLEGHPACGLVLALAIADRSAMDAQDWNRLGATGTGHLLAISGLHIGLAAMFGFFLGRLAMFALPIHLQLRATLFPAWFTALVAAAAYAGMAGFATSTQRALIMLIALAASRLSGRATHAARPFLLALATVLILDPLAPLTAGFWLSFLAVGSLLLMFAPRHRAQGRVATLLQAQLAITVVMLPIGMYWFQKGTALGLAANLVAIPWVSFLVVPLVLLGSAQSLLGIPGAQIALALAADAAGLLGQGLEWLSIHFQAATLATHKPQLPHVVTATVGGLLLLLPSAMKLRWCGAVLYLAVLLPRPQQHGENDIVLDLLDVGQGLAALIHTFEHTMIYDSGPGQPGIWNLVDSTIVPALAHAGRRRPDRIVVGHGDMDHAGGLARLRAWYPDAVVNANLGPHEMACITPLEWRWDGVEFNTLHPAPGLPYLGNASSCVLSIRSGAASLLLSGDIDSNVERRLVDRDIEQHRVVIAPHHGSRTSSSTEFINALKPDYVLYATGAGNRFGFPRSEVVERYTRAGATGYSTADCGGLRAELSKNGKMELSSARRERPAIWRWPAATTCP